MAFKVDIPGVKRDLIRYFQREINLLFKKYTEIIRDEIPTGNGPWGRTAWRDELRERIRLLPAELAGEVLYTKLNYPYDKPHPRSKPYIKFRIIQFGHDEEIRTKPGKQTWGKDIDAGKSPSGAKSAYALPGLTQGGSDFLGAAFKRIENMMNADISAIMANMPPEIVLSHFHLTKGVWK